MTVATALLRTFEDLRREDVDYAGGKGANLGELTAAGLPVPPGFVVGAPAYAAFCDGGGPARAHRGAARRASTSTTPRRSSGRDRRGARDGRGRAVPERLEPAIRAAYEELSGGDADAPVAVRSSATAEDTEAASFAGMNETFLNIRGADAVVDAVRRCWSSLFGARTVFYRAKRGFGQADMDIAVVVQRQIALHPRRGHVHDRPGLGRHGPARDRGLVRARRGGRLRQVSPDRYVVEKDDAARSSPARCAARSS